MIRRYGYPSAFTETASHQREPFNTTSKHWSDASLMTAMQGFFRVGCGSSGVVMSLSELPQQQAESGRLGKHLGLRRTSFAID